MRWRYETERMVVGTDCHDNDLWLLANSLHTDGGSAGSDHDVAHDPVRNLLDGREARTAWMKNSRSFMACTGS